MEIMQNGKTNILESIFICSMGKSFRAKQDAETIKINSSEANIEINYKKIDRVGKIKCIINNKKQFLLNGIKIKKLSDVLGNIHIVMFCPDDIEILKDGPAKRRKFINMMISQIKPKYVYILNQYLKVLEQRNTYLRQIKFDGKEEELLNIWDEKLAEYGYNIYEYRKVFLDKIKNKIQNIHYKITQDKEKIDIEYISDCVDKQKYIEFLKKTRKIDILRGYTTKGIHRDDFIININNKNITTYGSQGQHRTAILSLKLSELEIIYDEIGEYPILLLDDFMSELDESRREKLLENIEKAQVIITCTDKININKDNTLFNVKEGTVKRMV